MSKEIGREGEEIARQILLDNGYTLIESNYHDRRGEIDIVAKDKTAIVFVEVKYRKNMGFGMAEEFVTRSKIAKILKTSRHFLAERGFEESDWRVDVVAIDNQSGEYQLIQNVYIEGMN